jgi:hypothetical protein
MVNFEENTLRIVVLVVLCDALPSNGLFTKDLSSLEPVYGVGRYVTTSNVAGIRKKTKTLDRF